MVFVHTCLQVSRPGWTSQPQSRNLLTVSVPKNHAATLRTSPARQGYCIPLRFTHRPHDKATALRYAVPAARAFVTPSRNPQSAHLRGPMVFRGKSRARSAFRAGRTARLVSSTLLRPPPEQRARRNPLRTSSVPSRDLRTENHAVPGTELNTLQITATQKSNNGLLLILSIESQYTCGTAPTTLIPHDRAAPLDKRRFSGIISPAFQYTGLL